MRKYQHVFADTSASAITGLTFKYRIHFYQQERIASYSRISGLLHYTISKTLTGRVLRIRKTMREPDADAMSGAAFDEKFKDRANNKAPKTKCLVTGF